MSALEVFTHDGWQVRSMLIDGVPWFVARDVTTILGYTNGRDALVSHVHPDDKGVAVADTLGGRQQVATVNESGLWALIFGSRLPAAREFQRWVTAEVLPALRSTGSYSMPSAVPAVMPSHVEALRGWADALERAAVAEQRAAELAPAAAFADTLASAHGDYSVREAAQILDRDRNISTGEKRLFSLLRGFGWLDRSNQPYQGQVDAGRLVRKIGHYRDASSGELVAYSQVRVTTKGLRELHRRLGGMDTIAAIDLARAVS